MQVLTPKSILKAARRSAPLLGYFILGIAASWFIYAIVSLACPCATGNAGVVEHGNSEEPRDDTLAPSEPVRLMIPSVGIDASFTAPLGVTDAREIEVPDVFDKVGWYQHGPAPGEIGPAVIVGHVDSLEGPEVFHPLRRIKAGEVILIERADGTTVAFSVTKLEQRSQDGFPTEAVYGNLDHAGLRLITCSGTYNRASDRYSHNLIVYARLMEVTSGSSLE